MHTKTVTEIIDGAIQLATDLAESGLFVEAGKWRNAATLAERLHAGGMYQEALMLIAMPERAEERYSAALRAEERRRRAIGEMAARMGV